MPLSRLLAVGLWLVVTLASTAMVWTATSIVAADVTDRPTPVVAHQEVVSELASGARVATTTPTTLSISTGPAATVPPAGRPSSVAAPGVSVPTPGSTPTSSPPGRPTAVAAPAVVPTAPVVTVPAPPPAPRPIIPVASQGPTRPTATYSTTGGEVNVACSGILIELVSAIARNGYRVRIVSGGPGNVDVHFVGSGQDMSVKAVCFGEPIRYQ